MPILSLSDKCNVSIFEMCCTQASTDMLANTAKQQIATKHAAVKREHPHAAVIFAVPRRVFKTTPRYVKAPALLLGLLLDFASTLRALPSMGTTPSTPQRVLQMGSTLQLQPVRRTAAHLTQGQPRNGQVTSGCCKGIQYTVGGTSEGVWLKRAKIF